jgi:hypothetical protein
MERGIDDKTILDKFVIDFVNIIDKYTKYIIVSGFVAIAHGRSRATEDIDMIIERMLKGDFINMHNSLYNAGFVCIQPDDPTEIYDNYLTKGDSIRYVRKDEFVPEMEIKFAKDELDEQQIKERQKLELTGLDVYFSSIEMNIAFKEEYLKTDKDLEDARHLRIIYSEDIDENRINKIKEKINQIKLKE